MSLVRPVCFYCGKDTHELAVVSDPWTDACYGVCRQCMPGSLREALAWIQEFAAKMSDQHPGFVHVERKARAAFKEEPWA